MLRFMLRALPIPGHAPLVVAAAGPGGRWAGPSGSYTLGPSSLRAAGEDREVLAVAGVDGALNVDGTILNKALKVSSALQSPSLLN